MRRQQYLSFVVLVILGGIVAYAPEAIGQNQHDCSYCHVMHGAPGPSLNVGTDVEVICLTCHGPAGSSSLKADIHTNTDGSSHGAFRMTCVDCHTAHSDMTNWVGGTNIKQVGRDVDGNEIARINTPNSGIREVVFESRGTDANEPTLRSFADNDENNDGIYDGVCETCHTAASHHRNNLPDPTHYTGETCTTCHPHEDGFDPTAGACSDCHTASAGSRRPIIGEFVLASHHLQGASLDEADCTVCHDMSNHKQGNVRLKNVDAPSDPNMVVVLTGNPLTSSTEAQKLEIFCLACHDSDAAGGSAPFTDGNTPVAIDPDAWAAGSHSSSGPTCFGDGQFGCHGNGHASNKRKLLAPYGVAPTPPANAEEEEDFCFACHDANGPASSDVKGQFSASINWVTAAAGVNDSTTLNDRHDVQYSAQSISGAKIECTDCHDPHTASATSLVKADPDPGDGRVPGDGNTLLGADLATEWCLDCHDASLPSSITAPTTALADIRTAFQSADTHGLTSGSPSLKSGYGWAAGDLVSCSACHTSLHVSSKSNLFQFKDTVKSKDGLTDIPSDGVGFNYELTDNDVKTPGINGYEACNTCHIGSMGAKKPNCFSCHYHGTRF